MKKFLFILFISLFLVASVYVFLTGWTQIRIKPDSCGIVKSKLGGLKEKPVLPGEFSWHWDFVIPKNARLEQFSLLPYSAEKTVSGQSPVNELYTLLYNDNMNYSFEFSISLAIETDGIVKLSKKNIISNDDDLKNYMDHVADYVCQLAASYYLTKAQADPNFKPESVKRTDLVRALSLHEEYPEIFVTVLALRDYKIPNYTLYNKFQNMILQDPSLLHSLSPKTQTDSSLNNSSVSSGTNSYIPPVQNQNSNEENSTQEL